MNQRGNVFVVIVVLSLAVLLLLLGYYIAKHDEKSTNSYNMSSVRQEMNSSVAP